MEETLLVYVSSATLSSDATAMARMNVFGVAEHVLDGLLV
jgi:hypothetical protein